MASRSTKRTKPKLSYDRITKAFVVDCLRPHPEDSQWDPRDTRFVLWYHLTTILTFTSIAIAHNVTFPDDEPQMNERDVANIIEVVLNNNVPQIKNDLAPNGHWNRPTELGWIPCDHEMNCSKLANRDHRSVMRNTECRTRSEREARGIAEMLFQGSWPEILTCPREHVADSGPSSNGSDKENRNPAAPYLAPFRAATAAVARLASRSTKSSSRSQESQRSRPSPKSPPYRPWSSNDSPPYVGDGSPHPSNLASNPSNPDSHQQNLASNPSNSASARSDSAKSASFKSAKSEQSSQGRAANQVDKVIAGTATGDASPATWYRQTIALLGGAPAFWYVFQVTVFMLYWAVFLSSYLELHGMEGDLLSSALRLFVQFCTMLGAHHCVSAALAAFRRAIGRLWGIVINPPGTQGLSRATQMTDSVLAAALAAFICRCLGMLDNGWRYS
ncbi:hypothetical protein PV11_07881 [Exophiala sideris]|uniref:Uncharacterized protein n=1 Tax=Exophiala sideris TaxID=1016849 RepID=A0A0D1VVV3_9EURO|nr:hypothetical protein PV11_07881 [Exophiala sideris]